MLAADNGNVTKVMNISDFKQKIQNRLALSTSKKLSREHTPRILRKTNELTKLSSIKDDQKIPHRKFEAISLMDCRKFTKPKWLSV